MYTWNSRRINFWHLSWRSWTKFYEKLYTMLFYMETVSRLKSHQWFMISVFVSTRVASPYPNSQQIRRKMFRALILLNSTERYWKLPGKIISTTVTCAGEEVVSIFVEGHGHDSVSEVERFLYSVAMVNVNINVQHSRVVPSKRKPAQFQKLKFKFKKNNETIICISEWSTVQSFDFQKILLVTFNIHVHVIYMFCLGSHVHMDLLEKLQYCNNNVINITEPRGLKLLGVMKSPWPIHCYVTVL